MIQLNYRDPRPIYEQIKDQIKQLIYSETLEPDEKLPSVRELASKLAINPNTISRAYKELEQEGVIYSLSGKGTFINKEFDGKAVKSKELMQQFEVITKELLQMSISKEALEEKIQCLAESISKEKGQKENQEGNNLEGKEENPYDSGK